MTHQLAYAARTDRGLVRASNQDSVYAGDNLLVVADGMGGHAAGDMASRLVVSAFMPLDRRAPGGDLLRALARATRDGNGAISQVVRENPDLDGMGTTVTAVLFDGGRMGLAHVGDSRAYLYRDGVLHQLTHDDTFVQSLIDEGRITQEDAAHHPQRSLLLRALNGTEVDPSLTVREVAVGDRYLLCSDGLAGVVSAEAIAEALAESDPESSANQLVQLALSGGGPDNITVIVADVLAVGSGEDGAALAVAANPADPDATGPIGTYASVRMTQEMPRVPLPPIPEDTPARPDYAGLPAGAGTGPRSTDLDDGLDDDEDDLDADEPLPNVAPPRPPSRRGAVLAVVGGVLLVSAVVVGSFLWVNTQYFVGADSSNGQVVVYRGVDGSVLGLSLRSVQETSCEPGLNGCTPLYVQDLVPAARDQVNGGIQAGSLDDARKVITRLGGQLLPLCEPVGGTPSTAPTTPAATPSGSASGSTSPSLVTVPSLPVSGTPALTESVPTPAAAGSFVDSVAPSGVDASASPVASDVSTPASGSAQTSSTGTPLSTRAPEPGVNCRVAR